MPRKLIMCGGHPVLAFEYDPASGRACSSGEVLDHDRLPLEFTTHGKSALYAKRIDEWWRSRAIPSTRDGIRRVLESLGAASTDELLDRTYGLSLSDQYWVRREDDPVEWKDVNFFDNPFNEALGEILLTSYSSSHDISLNAPDVSTGGDLPKRWTIDKTTGRRLLVKSGRTGQEPMNEVIASKLCMRLGVPAVRYSLARNGNRLVSTCADMLPIMRSWSPPGRCSNPSKPPMDSTRMTSGSTPQSASAQTNGRFVTPRTIGSWPTTSCATPTGTTTISV